MRKFVALCLVFFLSFKSHADMFGGDVVVLTQILANAVQQLAQLKQIMDSGKVKSGPVFLSRTLFIAGVEANVPAIRSPHNPRGVV